MAGRPGTRLMGRVRTAIAAAVVAAAIAAQTAVAQTTTTEQPPPTTTTTTTTPDPPAALPQVPIAELPPAYVRPKPKPSPKPSPSKENEPEPGQTAEGGQREGCGREWRQRRARAGESPPDRLRAHRRAALPDPDLLGGLRRPTTSGPPDRRSSPRSMRSRAASARTSAPRRPGPWAGCSSCPRPGRPTASTPMRTATRTRTSHTTRSSPRRATCAPAACPRTPRAPSSPTTTPTGTSPR